MKQDLNKYIVNEFCKLQTDTEQRSFIENFRFLMMLNDFDFENYYSNKSLRSFHMAIGQRIKFFRNRKGMTQKQLGEILGKTSDVRMAQYE